MNGKRPQMIIPENLREVLVLADPGKLIKTGIGAHWVVDTRSRLLNEVSFLSKYQGRAVTTFWRGSPPQNSVVGTDPLAMVRTEITRLSFTLAPADAVELVPSDFVSHPLSIGAFLQDAFTGAKHLVDGSFHGTWFTSPFTVDDEKTATGDVHIIAGKTTQLGIILKGTAITSFIARGVPLCDPLRFRRIGKAQL